MNKKILTVIGLGVVLVLGYMFFSGAPGEVSKESDAEAGAIEGEVVEINLEQMAVDGPAVLIIESDSGKEVEVQVPSMELRTCPGRENMIDVFTLKIGDHVQVKGDIVGEAIVPCHSPDHYLKMIEVSE